MKYIYPNSFKELITLANEQSKEFYGSIPNFEEFTDLKTLENRANPYYVGFGNPGASILILGKEKGFSQNKKDQSWRESIANPTEWKNLIDTNIVDYKHKSYPAHATPYLNCLYPYENQMRSGHTWSKYQKLVDLIFTQNPIYPNSFLSKTFISEINHEPSQRSKGYKLHPERIKFLTNDFYQAFPVKILACGNYLTHKEIMEIFNVEFYKDISKSRHKLIVYKNGKGILINTRQLSMDVKQEHFENIKNEVINYL